MIPHFDEYKEYLFENYNKDSVRTQIMRLAKLDRAEKSLLDMSAEEMTDVFELDKKANSTIYNFFSIIDAYLKWLNSQYDISVFDAYYQLKKLKSTVYKHNNTMKDNYFSSFVELKTFLVKAEEDYLQEQEGKVSEARLDTILIKQKMFNAYIVLSWEQMKNEEMLALSLKDVTLTISSKQIMINNKLVSLSDDEINFLSEALDATLELHKQIKSRRNKSRRTLQIEIYDNLFNTSNTNILRNLRWCALGSSIEDKRLQIQNVTKAGIFYKLSQYEVENDCYFSEANHIDICSEILGVSMATAARLCNEYDKYKRSIYAENNNLSNL